MCDPPPNLPIPPLSASLYYTVHRRGNEIWYAIRDKKTKKFFQLGRREYLIASHFDGRLSAAEIAEAVSKRTDQPVVASEVETLFAWLSRNNMLQLPDAPAEPEPAKPKFVFSPLFMRLPFVEGKILERVASKLQFLISSSVLLTCAIIAFVAAAMVISDWSRFTSTLGKLFIPGAQVWWLIAWILLKTVHEFGHAIVAVRVGSRIRSAGISLIYFAPVPFVDISDLWTIPNKWQRILCSAGGMLFELSIASLATIIALTTTNESLQYFCCALASLGTFATLAFNANPLIRFDGYFILSDLLERPNLWTEGSNSVKAFTQKLRHPFGPLDSSLTAGPLLYGLACFAYRIVIMITIAATAIVVWQGIGVLLVIWGSIAAVLLPWWKQVQAKKTISQNSPLTPRLPLEILGRRIWYAFAAVAATLLLLFAPSPVQPTTPGVVTFRDATTLRVGTSGFIEKVWASPRAKVSPGDLLATLRNPELELSLQKKKVEVQTSLESMRSTRSQGKLAEFQTHQSKLESLQDQLAQLQKRKDNLEIRSSSSGTLIDFDLHRQLGRFLEEGTPVCTVANTAQLEIVASADQANAKWLRQNLLRPVSIWRPGTSRHMGKVDNVDPRGSTVLDQPALAAQYGGPLTVKAAEYDEKQGMQLTMPRFEVTLSINEAPCRTSQCLIPGQRVLVRLEDQRENLFQGIQRWCKLQWESILRVPGHAS